MKAIDQLRSDESESNGQIGTINRSRCVKIEVSINCNIVSKFTSLQYVRSYVLRTTRYSVP